MFFYYIGYFTENFAILNKRMSGVKPKVTLFMTSKYNNLGGRLILAEQKYSHDKKLRKINSTPTLNKNYMTYSISTSNLHKQKLNIYQQQAQRQHQKNLIHLANKVNRPKSMTDRKKDPNDFFAYPVYFFREVKHKNFTKRSISSKYGQVYDQYGLKSKNLKKGQNYIGQIDDYGIRNRQNAPKKTGKKRKVYTYHQNQKSRDYYQPQIGKQQRNQSQIKFEKLKSVLNQSNIRSQLPYLQSFTSQDFELFSKAVKKIVQKFNINSEQQLSYLKKIILTNIPKAYPTQFQKLLHQIFEELTNF